MKDKKAVEGILRQGIFLLAWSYMLLVQFETIWAA
jgi:hypothetical protein